jgi:DinB superfamily
MNAKDVILQSLGFNDTILNAYLSDLSDADLLHRPVPGQNHIAWQLGHLITSERSMLEGIKPGSSPALPEGFVEAHNKDACTSNDSGKFCSKDTYLELFKAQRAASKKVLDELSDTDLDAPAPERLRRMVPTVGGVFSLFGNHVLMHSGQFVSVRRLLKKPISF